MAEEGGSVDRVSSVRRLFEKAGGWLPERCGDEKNRRTGSSLRAAGLHPFQKFGAKVK